MKKNTICVLMLVLAMALGASGCSLFGKDGGSSTSTGGVRGTKTYTVRGKTYQPLISAEGFREEGIASWYGSDFHGKKTANGEVYDMYGMTAAHKLLPFNTQVKVTNRNNGRSIVVRVNDRGPFVGNRVIDLTRTGAEKLGMIQAGTAPVLIETVGSVKGMSKGDLAGNFYIQVGAFANQDNAKAFVQNLRNRGFGARTYMSRDVGLWRVQIGPYPSLNNAEERSSSLGAEFPNNFVVAE